MTNEKAIEILKEYIECKGTDIMPTNEDVEAFELAMKAFEFINETKYQSVKISIPSIHMSSVFQDMSGTSDEFIFNIAKRYLDYLSGKTTASYIMTNTYHLQNPESMFSFNDEKYITTIAKVYQSLNQEKRKTRSTRTR